VTLSPTARKSALLAHVVSSVGWLGGVVVFLALAVAALRTDDSEVVRATVIAMDVVGWSVLVPLAAAAFVTGLLGAIGSPWGLLDHYWVVVKLILTVLATAVLLVHLEPVAAAADGLRTGGVDLGTLRERLVVQSAAALGVLLFAAVLSVFKPKGRTRRGWRNHQAGLARAAGARTPT
jgi:uncharacterized membrane protein